MKRSKTKLVLLAATIGMLAGCGKSIPLYKNVTSYDDVKKLPHQDTYRAYLAYLPSTFNSAITNKAEDADHIANFVDGLVENDRFGNLVPCLATGWTSAVNPNYVEGGATEENFPSSSFKFTIRDTSWVKQDGTEYAKVKPSDWVTAAQYVLDFTNDSEASYLYTMIVDGASEYYYATYFGYLASLGYFYKSTATQWKLSDDGTTATRVELAAGNQIRQYHFISTAERYISYVTNPDKFEYTAAEAQAYNQARIDNQATGDDALVIIGKWLYLYAYYGYVSTCPGFTAAGTSYDQTYLKEHVLSFKNVKEYGIIADDENNTLEYRLTASAYYFPTMLTYTPFLPICSQFVDEVGFDTFGSTPEDFLYNGAYRCEELGASGITYVKNESYWDKDNIFVDTVKYYTVPDSISFDFTRKKFEAGQIDGFSVSSQDTAGWKKYVTGKDGKGTVQNPASDYAYANQGQGDKSTFMFYLNSNRGTEEDGQAYMSTINKDYKDRGMTIAAEIENTNKALHLSDMRQAVLDGLDYEVYNVRNGATYEIQNQYQVHTYTPKYFLTYEGKDYTEYFAEAYAKHEKNREAFIENPDSVSVSTDEIEAASKKLEPGQVVNNQKSADTVKAEVDAAVSKLSGADITWPIKIEYVGFYFDTDANYVYDCKFLEATNERLNGCIIDEKWASDEAKAKYKVAGTEGAPEPKVVLTYNSNVSTSEVYVTFSSNNAYTLFISGWGPDYGDPLTYMNTLTSTGDLSTNFGWEYYDEDVGDKAETYNKLAIYDAMVSKAADEVKDNGKRYQLFAEAETYALTELGCIRPLYQRGQGWSCSVTKIVPYRAERAGYGLSSSKMKFVEVLKGVLSGAAKEALRTEWKAQAAEAEA